MAVGRRFFARGKLLGGLARAPLAVGLVRWSAVGCRCASVDGGHSHGLHRLVRDLAFEPDLLRHDHPLLVHLSPVHVEPTQRDLRRSALVREKMPVLGADELADYVGSTTLIFSTQGAQPVTHGGIELGREDRLSITLFHRVRLQQLCRYRNRAVGAL